MGNEGVASIIKALRAKRGVSTSAREKAKPPESKEVNARPAKISKKKLAKKKVVKKAIKKTVKPTSSAKPKAPKRVAKVRAKKPSASEASGRSFGQSGPKVDLTTAKLNQKELAVLNALNESAGSMTIGEIAKECFKGVPSSVANSMVRNALRRLVRGEAVEKVEKGVYQG